MDFIALFIYKKTYTIIWRLSLYDIFQLKTKRHVNSFLVLLETILKRKVKSEPNVNTEDKKPKQWGKQVIDTARQI